MLKFFLLFIVIIHCYINIKIKFIYCWGQQGINLKSDRLFYMELLKINLEARLLEWKIFAS